MTRLPERPCLQCGKKTMSKFQVCRGCHVREHPTKSPCVECGRMTQRKDRVCRPCSQPVPDLIDEHMFDAAAPELAGKRSRRCVCGVLTTRDDLCTACEAASKDSESPWDLGEGDWALQGSKRVWVPAGTAEEVPVPRGRCPVCTKRFAPTRRQIYCGRRCKDGAMYRRQMKRLEQERAAMNPHLAALLNDLDDAAKETAA